MPPQDRNSATATAANTVSTERPMPSAAFSVMWNRLNSLIAASIISGIGDRMHRNVAIAIFGAAARRSAR